MEDLIIIKENKSKIEAFKEKGTYNLKRIDKAPFMNITVDEVIAGLVEEELDDELEGSDVFGHEHDENCETLFFINDDSDQFDLMKKVLTLCLIRNKLLFASFQSFLCSSCLYVQIFKYN